MTLRDFDPAFSDDLRRELVQRAGSRRAERPVRTALRRPAVWITVVTATVLLAATAVALQSVRPAPHPAPAAPGSRIVDPLSDVRAGDVDGVSRHPRVLLHRRGIGPEQRDYAFDVPAGVTDVRVLASCTADAAYEFGVLRHRATGNCLGRDDFQFDVHVRPGERNSVEFGVSQDAAFILLVVAIPTPAVEDSGLTDPLRLRQRSGSALAAEPLLRIEGGGDADPVPFPVPAGTTRLRAFLLCRPASAHTVAVVDGQRVTGCADSLAHHRDITVSAGTVVARVVSPSASDWALLVVALPAS